MDVHSMDFDDLALYDNKSRNDPRDYAKPVKAIALPQDDPSTSDCRLIELENQFQRLMEAHLPLTQPTQVNKVTTLCEICSGPHDTQDCMEDPEQAFVEYASSRTDEAGGALPSDTVKNLKLSTSPVLSAHFYPNMDPQCSTHIQGLINTITIHSEKQRNSYEEKAKENEEEEKDGLENIYVNASTPPDLSVTFITKKVLKFNSFFESLRLVPQSSDIKVVCSKGGNEEVMFIELIRKNDDSSEREKRKGVQQPKRLYLMRRSLEVLRKFHWMILGGRFNQLSHVSSPLLSKPGEY
nr:MAK10-like protein [Tanacetum cinerariifolium]